MLELSLFVPFSCPVKHRELHLYPGTVSTHLMGMDKLSLQLSKDISADRRPSTHPGHSEAGSHTFGDAEIIPPTLTLFSILKAVIKMQETFFLQAVPFCVSFVVQAFLTDYFSQSTSPSISTALLEQLGYFVFPPCPSASSSCIHLLARGLSCKSSSPARLSSGLPTRPPAPSGPPMEHSSCLVLPPHPPRCQFPSQHLLPTCQAGSAPQFHQVAWG